MFQRLFIILKLATQNLLASKGRTVLTILGMIIGIAAVIIVLSIGGSAQALILDQVRNIGSNLVVVLPGASEEDGPPAIAYGVISTTLTNDDLDAMRVRSNVPHLAYASGYVFGDAAVQYRNKSYQVNIQGVSADFVNVETTEVAEGRFFSEKDDAQTGRIAVLGSARAKDLFGDEDPVGKTIKVGDYTMRVIGVMKERGSASFQNPDDVVFVPILTAQKLLFGVDYLTAVRATVDAEQNIDRTKEDIKKLLRDRHDIKYDGVDDFSVRSADTALGILTNVTNVIKYFLASVAAVSLIVGGIGIMNIMLISLSRRIRELGLRKALGAMNRDIMFQMLVESVFIAIVGAVIGILLGIGVSWLAAVVIKHLGYEWTFILTAGSVALSLGIAVLIGILAGAHPARRAARVSPTEALRYE